MAKKGSIWGKILGGGIGFAAGGPIGALIGALAGHAVDEIRKTDLDEDGTRRVAFTIAAIVLGAKMAKADGVVTRDEIDAFKEVFRVPADEMKNVGRVFNQARKDSQGFEPYARQVARMFEDNPAVLEELLACLLHIAKADGVVSAEEISYLRRVAEIFGLDADRFEHLRAAQAGPPEADPYTVLGIRPDVDNDTLKAAYRKLVRENHPDALIAQGVPQEFIDVANEKLANINAAYEDIQRRRGLN